jgi:tetratricopeptide (TPR) repeat protein
MRGSDGEQGDLRRYRATIRRARRLMREGRAAASTPNYLSACLGREQELQRIAQWYHAPNAPLLTLIGESGIGKTHLGCAFLGQMLDSGVPCVYVNLTLLKTADEILASLFHTLDISFPLPGWRRLLGSLFAGGALIVLDDFDHLLPDGAASVQALLEAAPNAKILATSQKPLGLAVEQTLNLQPLSLPPTTLTSLDALKEYPSAALVLQQIGELPKLMPKDIGEIAQLCTELKGHPGKLVTLGLYLHHDFRCLHNPQLRSKLGLLPKHSQTRNPQREHPCLMPVLREEELRILRCLLVFAEDFETAAAAAAAQISPAAMQSFLDAMTQRQLPHDARTQRSFLQQSCAQILDLKWYRIHPQMRPLIPPLSEGERQVVMARLHDYYWRRLQRLPDELPVDRIRLWCFQQVNTLRSVLEYLAEQKRYTELAAVLGQLTRMCANRPPAKLLDWGYDYIQRTPDTPDAARAAVAYAIFDGLTSTQQNERAAELVRLLEPFPEYAYRVGRFWHDMGEGDRAHQYYRIAWEQAESTRAREAAVMNAASLAECEAVIGNLRMAEGILRDIKQPPSFWRMPSEVRIWVHYVDGYANYQQGRFQRSRELYRECLKMKTSRKLKVFIDNSARRELSRVCLELGDYARAERYALEGLEECDATPALPLRSRHALEACLGDLDAVLGRYDDAFQRHLPTLEFWQKEKQPRWVCWTLNRLAEIELLARDADHPWRLAHAMGRDAHSLLQEAWEVIEPTYMNLPHKSRTLHNLGWLAWHEGRLDEAEQYLTRALEIRQTYGNEYGVARTLEILARLRASQQRYDEARDRFRHASAIRQRLDAKLYPAIKHCNLSIQRSSKHR